MGAAINKDGSPSGALVRRVNSALSMANSTNDAQFIVTGGIGENKISSEAEAMKKIIVNAGISTENIIVEDNSTDTLSSIVNCSAILKNNSNIGAVYVCSDTYHIPRCRWLFLFMGIRTLRSNVRSGLKANGLLRWVFYHVREFVALPYDTLLILVYRFKNRKVAAIYTPR